MREPPTKTGGKPYNSEQWALGVRFIYDKLDQSFLENWYCCMHCKKLWNRFLSSGTSDMLKHVQAHKKPKGYNLTQEDMFYGEIPPDIFKHYLPKPDAKW